MRDYLKFVALFYGLIALVPFVFGMVSALPGVPGPVLALLFFGALSAFVALVIGAVVFLIHGVRCAKQLRDPLPRATVVLASPVLTLAVLLAMLPLAVMGHSLGDQANWNRYRPRYQTTPPIIVQPVPPEMRDQGGRSSS